MKTINREEYLEDIYFMINTLKKEHVDLFHNITEKDFDSKVEAILNSYGLNNSNEFIYVVNLILALINDPHTTMYPKIERHYLPIDIRFLDNKLYVSNASDEYSYLIGTFITKINGINIENLINEFKLSCSFLVKEWLYFLLEFNFIDLSSVICLPSMNNATGIIQYEFSFNNGNNHVVSFDIDKEYDQPCQKRIPNYSLEIDSDNKTLIVNYRKCKELPELPMIDFVNLIKNAMIDNKITNIIVDLRNNTGGNSEIIKPLLSFLKENKTNILVLINGGIFSSGDLAVSSLKKIGALTMGTPTGTTINNYGEVRTFILPNTDYTIGYSTKYFYILNDEIRYVRKDGYQELLSTADKSIFVPIQNIPDYLVTERIEDIIHGDDTCKMQAIQLLNEINDDKKRTNGY